VIRIIVSQLRRRAWRATALLVGVLVATSGFVVLTSSTEASRLIVQGTVDENARSAYDILVRPRGARTALEDRRGLVRSNFLAGLYGGITANQWHRIAALEGVDVAAPIAMLGYVTTHVGVIEVDVTRAVDPTLETQLIRVRFVWRAERGLTNAPDPEPSLVYVTKRRVLVPAELPTADEDVLYPDGVRRPQGVCGEASLDPYEVQPDGSVLPLCLGASRIDARALPRVATLTPRGTFIVDGTEQQRLRAGMHAPISMLAAAIDPPSEARLVGLDRAISRGRYLSPNEAMLQPSVAPVLLASEPYVDERADAVAERIATSGLAGADDRGVARLAATARSEVRLPVEGRAVEDLYRVAMAGVTASGDAPIAASFVKPLRAGPPVYDESPDGTLHPREAADPAASALLSSGALTPMPLLATDIAQRSTEIRLVASPGGIVIGQPIGVFDRARIQTGNELTTPLETYTQTSATGADERSRGLLAGQPLFPTSNVGGYLATSPTVLLALSTLWNAGGDVNAISAVRVRVAEVTGFDAISRERVRVVAESIAATTGLDVEVMLGASRVPQRIDLGPGRYGRPRLALDELWSKKGVAAAIVRAVDRKSVVLFGLILAVCMLFLSNAVAAALRERRRELAILVCLGWSRRRLAGLFFGELAMIGGLAGVLSAALAPLLGAAIDVRMSVGRAVLAVPVALGTCLLAAALPALTVSGVRPAAALSRSVSPPGRMGRGRRRRLLGLALANLRRTPRAPSRGKPCRSAKTSAACGISG
jgi:putative ABC transport system permease protein